MCIILNFLQIPKRSMNKFTQQIGWINEEY